jgi:transcriptional regulator with XRE-family HTH domain
MRPFRTAGKKTTGTEGLLRAMREALGVRLEEISEKTGLGRSTVNDSERREMAQTITMRTLSRMAAGLGCKVVYGVVPLKGKTLEDLAEERLWRKVLGTGNRD